MTQLSKTKLRKPQHVCLFGFPGTGKTTLAGKLAEEGYKINWFSIDNGHAPLYELSEAAKDRINLINLPDTRDFQVGYATCVKLATGLPFNLCSKHGQIECSVCKQKGGEFERVCLAEQDSNTVAVFDPISQISRSAINFILKDKSDEFKPEWDHWRYQGNLMHKFLTYIQQAPYHAICITHAVEARFEDGKKCLVPEIGTDNFSRNAGGFFDHLVYCEVTNARHKFGSGTTYSSGVTTKSRRHIKIEDMKEPSLKPFFDGTGNEEESYGDKQAAEVLAISSASNSIAASAGGKSTAASSAAIDSTRAAEVLARLKGGKS
jgi:DNA polymerase III delta prime subunit